MSEIITVGLDLAKNVFQAHGADASGRALLRKKLRRDQVLAFFGQLPPCVVVSIGPRPDPAHLTIRLPANMLTPIARRRGPANSSATVPDVEETDSNIRLNSPPWARMIPVRQEV